MRKFNRRCRLIFVDTFLNQNPFFERQSVIPTLILLSSRIILSVITGVAIMPNGSKRQVISDRTFLIE